jgi:1,2-diacylglycerol 3-beta-glucosyltransferase
MGWLDVALCVAFLPIVAGCVWVFFLTLLSGRPKAPPPPSRTPRFDVIVPAHDEAAGIGRTVQNLLQLDYPHDARRVVVIADNCSDDTAARAREAGAVVLERTDTVKRGKGYALELAFSTSRREGFAEAVVVVDADTRVSPNLLTAFARRIEEGAAAAQAYYAVDNVEASWRTALMAVAFGMFHRVRGRARERLKLSSGLKGNGMCFTHAVLVEVPHQAFSVVEDLEYGIELGKRGHRVWYVDEAQVNGEMVSGEKASRSQRVRWEAGRRAMVKAHARQLLAEAVAKKSPMLLDLGLDLLVPPISYLGVGAVALSALGAYVAARGGLGLSAALGGFCVAALALHLAAGWWLSGTGVKGLKALALAPFYVLWKLRLMWQRGSENKVWVRTERERRP